ncbi:hypothetical protein SMSRO_SF029330 [Spiroplasma poulsonii]|uniref:Uncharacterized protein n=2 Tax=Spiroplasma poulsonii TaxID=2138 RepID=A0A2P6F8J0_9MOLU|nr:hypothetical protein SMSRO_SF029330 [Spiroplasma poulsonii]
MTNWPWRIDKGTHFKSVYRWNLTTTEPKLVIDNDGNVKVKGGDLLSLFYLGVNVILTGLLLLFIIFKTPKAFTSIVIFIIT